MTVHAALRCDLCGRAFTVDYDPTRAVSVNEARRWARGNGWHRARRWSWAMMRRVTIDICSSPEHALNHSDEKASA